MQIHTLPTRNTESKKRIGRGGRRGTYSGRGNKGQKARSGGNVDPLFEGGRSSLIERLKKARGFTSVKDKKIVLTLDKLQGMYDEGEVVSLESLVEKKIVSRKDKRRGAKILGTGTIEKKLIISPEIDLSESAHKSLEKAGATFQEEKK